MSHLFLGVFFTFGQWRADVAANRLVNRLPGLRAAILLICDIQIARRKGWNLQSENPPEEALKGHGEVNNETHKGTQHAWSEDETPLYV